MPFRDIIISTIKDGMFAKKARILATKTTEESSALVERLLFARQYIIKKVKNFTLSKMDGMELVRKIRIRFSKLLD